MMNICSKKSMFIFKKSRNLTGKRLTISIKNRLIIFWNISLKEMLISLSDTKKGEGSVKARKSRCHLKRLSRKKWGRKWWILSSSMKIWSPNLKTKLREPFWRRPWEPYRSNWRILTRPLLLSTQMLRNLISNYKGLMMKSRPLRNYCFSKRPLRVRDRKSRCRRELYTKREVLWELPRKSSWSRGKRKKWHQRRSEERPWRNSSNIYASNSKNLVVNQPFKRTKKRVYSFNIGNFQIFCRKYNILWHPRENRLGIK